MSDEETKGRGLVGFRPSADDLVVMERLRALTGAVLAADLLRRAIRVLLREEEARAKPATSSAA